MPVPQRPDDYADIFERFALTAERREGEWFYDRIGVRQRRAYDEAVGSPPSPTERVDGPGHRPPVDEEFFEWADLLHAVSEARDRFVMIELGAGFGRWSVRGAKAARQAGIPFALIGVEGEPTHFQWLAQHLRDNEIDPSAHWLIHAAVSDGSGGTVPFSVGNPSSWYGQSIAPSMTPRLWASRLKCKILGREWQPAPIQEVPSIALSSILERLDHVDLIDCDIQGAEAAVFPEAIEELDRKVRRLHIETHDVSGEAILRVLLRRHGWECLHDFPQQETIETPYGPVYFQGGVQSWINPRFH